MNSKQLDLSLADCLERRQSHEGLTAMCEHSTPKQVVWWGCLCAWSVWRPEPPKQEDKALSIASRWVATEEDEHRINALNEAKLNEELVGSWLLKAVVNSGGTLATPDQSADQPTPDFAGLYINGFLQQLLSQVPPVQREIKTQTFVQIARQSISEPLPTVMNS